MENRNGPHLLADSTIKNATDDKSRVYNDGGALPGVALEIHVRNGGTSKRAYFRYNGSPFGEQRTARLPLGCYYELGLAALRRKRAACETLIEQNKSPKAHAHEVLQDRLKYHATNITVADAIDQFFAFCEENRWGKKSKANWHNTRRHYLDPICASPDGKYRLRTIDHTHVAGWLKLAGKKHGTHDKLHSFFHGLFDYYTARKAYDGPNPASWEEKHPLFELLPKLPPHGHFKAMPPDDVPLIVADLIAEIQNSHPGFVTPAQAAFGLCKDTTAIYSATKKGCFPNRIKEKKHNLLPIEEVEKTFGKFKREPMKNEREDVRLCAYALLYVFCTMVRPEMAVKLKWGQIKWDENRIEYLPKTQTTESQHKTGHDSDETYLVILSDGVRRVLEAMQQWARQNDLPMGDDDYVFAHGSCRVGLNVRRGLPPTASSLLNHLKRRLAIIPGIKARNATTSSIRNGFPKWAYERRGYDYVLIDLTLGHRIPPVVLNKTNKAYFRGPEFIKRRGNMIAKWEQFIFSERRLPQRVRLKNVVPFRRSASA